MKISIIFSVLGLLSAATAAPITTPSKRTLPRLGGLNIAGCDFGMNVWGWSGTSYCPSSSQIGHFVDQGSNVIRLPVGWQYLVGNNPASTSLDPSFFATYDALVQGVTSRGAYAIIDIHNYGRWNSGVIGVDGPSNAAFASLWSLLAKKYANNGKVMFGIMNEPHDQDTGKLATTCQAAVDAIRAAGAKSQTIILPGNSWDNAGVWASGANEPILGVTDPATGDASRLILDVHKYLDSDGSGTSHECVTDGLDLLKPLVNYLHAQGRKAIITELGGATTASCQNQLPKMLQYVVNNSDVFVGFTAWAAGSFAPYPGYELSLTPNADGSDNALWTKAIKPFLPGKNAVVTSSAPSSTSKPAVSSTSKPVVSTSKPVVSSSVPAALSTSNPVITSSSAPAVSSTSKPVVVSSSAPVVSSTSKPVVVSSSAPVVSSSTPAVVASSSAASVIPTPATSSYVPTTSGWQSSYSSALASSASAAASSSTPVQSTPAPQPSAPVAGNLQPYTGALGGITAPAVTKSGDKWTTNNQMFNFLIDALNRSCYTQMDKCQFAANRGGNVAPLTVANCETTVSCPPTCDAQIQACLAAAAAAA